MSNQLLRYNISNWNQLTKCQSNNSRDLHIHVSHIINDPRVSGTVIRVDHCVFGTLFACLVDSSGPLLSVGNTGFIPEFTTIEILRELRKFGFYVTYNPATHLDGNQLQYLMVLDGLGFDKIRVLNVYSSTEMGKTFSPKVVAFNVADNSDWLNNGYSASETEFTKALNNGSAINISGMSEKNSFRWDWLTYVANIKDILEENA